MSHWKSKAQSIAIALSVAKVKPSEWWKMDKKMDKGRKEKKVEKKEYKSKK